MGDGTYGINANETDPILRKYKHEVKDFAYIGYSVQDYQRYISNETVESEISFSDLANIISKDQEVQSVQPSTLLDDSFSISWQNDESGLPLTD